MVLKSSDRFVIRKAENQSEYLLSKYTQQAQKWGALADARVLNEREKANYETSKVFQKHLQNTECLLLTQAHKDQRAQLSEAAQSNQLSLF